MADVTIKVDTSEIDAAIEKAKLLKKLLEEANSLMDELASCRARVEDKLELEV